MQKTILFLSSLLLSCLSMAQIVSGPMIGHVEFRTATIWMHLEDSIEEVTVQYIESNLADRPAQQVKVKLPGGEFNTATVHLTGLEPGKMYTYYVYVKKGPAIAKGEVRTQTLWQWRTNPPDFSFLTGSCNYINESKFDRPGRPYGGDSSIFATMAKEKADFMLWLGDNWYTREVDYYSNWGLMKRPATDRSQKILQPFLQSMPHYAIWDDHDYGWNDADKSYPLKKTSRDAFMKFWANPSYGNRDEGIYTQFTWNDVDFFLLDNRWWRANDNWWDSSNGQSNPDKTMFGKEQINWLKNALLSSKSNRNINFRIIATGSQVLNPISTYDVFRKYSKEYEDFIQFLQEAKIPGVIFLTGDRHHSEIIEVKNVGMYPLYDITSSPLTAGTHVFDQREKNNSYRILGVDKYQNYARISISGTGKERTLQVSFIGLKGEIYNSWSIQAKNLNFTTSN